MIRRGLKKNKYDKANAQYFIPRIEGKTEHTTSGKMRRKKHPQNRYHVISVEADNVKWNINAPNTKHLQQTQKKRPLR